MELGFDPTSVPLGAIKITPRASRSREEEHWEIPAPHPLQGHEVTLWESSSQRYHFFLPSSAVGRLYQESRRPPVVCQTYWKAGSSTWHPPMSTHSTSEALATAQTKHRLKRSAKKTNPQSREHLAAARHLIPKVKSHKFQRGKW